MHAKNLFAYHPLVLALCLSGLPLSAALAADQPDTVAPGGALELQETNINAKAVENPTGHVRGPVATRSTSASKTDAAIKEIPQSVSIITRDEMDERKADTLAEVLSFTPGVITQPGGFSRVGDDFVIRGFNVGSGTGGILRDGMKLQGSVYDGGIEPYGLERVEVVKGASSVLYGQLSPGGLIHTPSLSRQRAACQLSRARPAYTCALAHSGSQLFKRQRVPYTTGSRASSSSNVPNSRSHTIRMPP